MSDEVKPQGKPQAKAAEPTVAMPASLLAQLQQQVAVLQARLDMADAAERMRLEAQSRKALVVDDAWEQLKAEISRPASVRTQEIADRKYGTKAPRFRIRMDSTTEDGKPGPNVSEHFPLEISGNSDLEAKARYLEVMGVRKHDYKLVAEQLAA